MSKNAVQAYGLMKYMTPTSKRYITASGDSVGFLGQLENIPIKIGDISIRVSVQVTNAQNYPILIGEDVMKLLRLDVLTSVGRIAYFDKGGQGYFLPFYADYVKVPGPILKQLETFLGLYPA